MPKDETEVELSVCAQCDTDTEMWCGQSHGAAVMGMHRGWVQTAMYWKAVESIKVNNY